MIAESAGRVAAVLLAKRRRGCCDERRQCNECDHYEAGQVELLRALYPLEKHT